MTDRKNHNNSRSRTINHYLRKCILREKQLEKAQKWAKEWHDKEIELLNLLDNTAGEDWDKFEWAMKELRATVHKKHEALQGVMQTLTEPLRQSRNLAKAEKKD